MHGREDPRAREIVWMLKYRLGVLHIGVRPVVGVKQGVLGLEHERVKQGKVEDQGGVGLKEVIAPPIGELVLKHDIAREAQQVQD